MTHENGMKGRAVAPLPSFTLPDSGITVQLRRLSPDAQERITQAVAAEIARPEPPLQEVTDLDGKTTQMPNPDEPEYRKRLLEYWGRVSAEVGLRYFKLVLSRIVVDVDPEAVRQVRDEMAAVGVAIPEDQDDRELYIRYVCITSLLDLDSLMAYFTSRNSPTEAAVKQHMAMFRGQVSGQ